LRVVNFTNLFGFVGSKIRRWIFWGVFYRLDWCGCGVVCSWRHRYDVDGSSGKVELEMIRHNSRLHISYGTYDTI
jgi:hypothetical protein